MEMNRESGAGKILVAIGPSPNSRHLVRWAHKTASALGWEWLALHVDSGRNLSREDGERLESNLALARSFGAEVLVQEAPDIAAAVVETARDKKATMLVIGRSGLSRLGFLPRRPTVTDRIIREADPLDVAVVQDAESPRKDMTLDNLKAFFRSPLREYALLFISFIFVTGLGFLASPRIGYRSISFFYLAAVLGLSFLARPAPVALFAGLSALVLNFFFMEPQYTFRITRTEDVFLFVIYFLVAFVTSALVARLRLKETMLSERERRNAFLLASTQKLAECRSTEEAAEAAIAIIRQFCATQALFLVPGDQGNLTLLRGADNAEEPDEETIAAAACAFSDRKVCGRGTGILSGARFRCIPAAAGEYSAGVIALTPPDEKPWRISDDSLILSLGRTFAFIVERERSEEMRRKAALSIESERLSKVLLDSVSHELRTPLTMITGSISALRDDNLAENPESRRILVDGALDASDRLNRIVEDILSMSRIESGSLRLSTSLVDLSDLANEALAVAGPELDESRVKLTLPAEASPARVDLGLAARLAANLLRNAARYSPPESRIDFTLSEEGESLSLMVRDYGPGVPERELESIFERFRRGRGAHGGGLGLGLAICRGIAAAHGGNVTAQNAADGGLEVKAVFPSCVERFPE
jgi:two-component system, OmpR family, sensor histidine kinase KdpD